MGLNKVKNRYASQKCAARCRGIEWHLTFDIWVEWWATNLGQNWFEKRGRRRGQYVMSRKRDKGPYALWNIECITHEQNRRDQAIYGTYRFSKIKLRKKGKFKHAKKLTAEKVLAIYHATGTQKSIGDAYRVSDRMVRLIKGKKWWKSVLPL